MNVGRQDLGSRQLGAGILFIPGLRVVRIIVIVVMIIVIITNCNNTVGFRALSSRQQPNSLSSGP